MELARLRRLPRPPRRGRHRGERGLPRRSLRAPAPRDGRRGHRRRGDRRPGRRDAGAARRTRSAPARWASPARRPRRTTTATATRCRRGSRRATSWSRSRRCSARTTGTQLELIIPGCLNGFSDAEVDLMVDLCLAAQQPPELERARRQRDRQPRAPARGVERGRRTGRTGRRPHDPAVDAHPAVVPLGLRARRPARLARGPRHAGRRSGSGCSPTRRCGPASTRGRTRRTRACSPTSRAGSGSPSPRRSPPRPARTRAARSATIAAERGVAPFDALLDVVVADGLRTGLRPELPAEDDATWQARADVWRDPRAVVGASDAGAHLDMFCMAGYSTFLVGPAVRDLGSARHRGGGPAPHRRSGASLRTRRTRSGRARRARRPRGVRSRHRRSGPRAHPRRPPRRREPARRRERGRGAGARGRDGDRRRRDVHRRDARHRPPPPLARTRREARAEGEPWRSEPASGTRAAARAER